MPRSVSTARQREEEDGGRGDWMRRAQASVGRGYFASVNKDKRD